jgi:hypothetical protein
MGRHSVASMHEAVLSVVARRLRRRTVVELETSPSVISCMYFAGSGQVDPACLSSIGCSGFGSTEYGRAAWTRWCWSSPPPSFNGTAKASAYSGVGVRNQDDRQ